MAESQSTPTIIVTLKLRPTKAQARMFDRWIWHLTGVYNWTIKTIEREAERGAYLTRIDINRLLVGHSQRMGIPDCVLRGAALTAMTAWQRCLNGHAGRPKLKGQRRPLNSIAFIAPVVAPRKGRVRLRGVGPVRFHRQQIPGGAIRSARIVKRASGWHLCLFVKAAPATVPRCGFGEVGIDPGFSSIVALSTGELITHPRELADGERRLSQAQRGRRGRLAGRLHERIGNRRKNRNHHLSRRLVSENTLIAMSADRTESIARMFGKSVASAGHSQLRSMLRYKSLTGGTEYIEVPSRNSTKTCSACGALTGPTGLAGLKVRQWDCGACGAHHDRDVNAAVNTLIAGRGMRHKSRREAATGIAIQSNTAMFTGGE